MFTSTERVIRAIVRHANERPAMKRVSHAFLRTAGMRLVQACSRNLLHVTNAAVLDTLPQDRGVLVTSHHRSFADMYVLSSVMLRRCRWVERMYFPVRSEYFYDRWGGLLINAFVAGLSMYPPIVHRARPVVLPAFILGVSNDPIAQARGNFNRTGAPITVTFGAPLALDAWLAAPPGRRSSLRIAQAIRAEIEKLGTVDRAIRARLAEVGNAGVTEGRP